MRIAPPRQEYKIRCEALQDIAHGRYGTFPSRISGSRHIGIRQPEKQAWRIFNSETCKSIAGFPFALCSQALAAGQALELRCDAEPSVTKTM